MNKGLKIRLYIVFIYVLLLVGIAVPILLYFLNCTGVFNTYKSLIPSIAAVLVALFQKNASQPMIQRASFATPGLDELRKKHQKHVNNLEKAWLVLAIFAIIIVAV